MHILLTRPLEDCKDLIVKFKSLGHKVSHLPVIKVESLEYEQPDFNNYKGIIFTSANAVKNLNLINLDKKINCFCVGSATEKIVKQNGFQNIFCADGNVNNLKEIILQNFDYNQGKLLYISGEIISSSLDRDLILEGYSVKRIVNYNVIPIDEMNEEFVKDIKSSIPDMIFIYSQNSAKNYLNLLKKYSLTDIWMDTNLMCLGEKTSQVLNEIKWKKIFLFNPGEEEFLLYKI
tara:strand:+ start:261 stop:959 length:699 start_codon:yes stop_codon:yes gene_type:complete